MPDDINSCQGGAKKKLGLRTPGKGQLSILGFVSKDHDRHCDTSSSINGSSQLTDRDAHDNEFNGSDDSTKRFVDRKQENSGLVPETTSSHATQRSRKRLRRIDSDSEEDKDARSVSEGESKHEAWDSIDEEDFADIPDDFDSYEAPRKKAKKSLISTSAQIPPSSPLSSLARSTTGVSASKSDLLSLQVTSSTKKWTYNPENVLNVTVKDKEIPNSRGQLNRSKHANSNTCPNSEQRYPWLQNITDAERRQPTDPDYDPQSLYIPPTAWHKFSPFEKQYWEIKQNLWDTVVFFKKGKFYELYEQDAAIGHQLFDLKITDRVNMRMVGVPEANLDMWISRFIAAGYKIAKVDQVESALAKEMRERDERKAGRQAFKKPSKGANTTNGSGKEGIIRRELTSVMTIGTLIDGNILKNDMATYCLSLKQVKCKSQFDGTTSPTSTSRTIFGICFVDCATSQFFLTQIEDDVNSLSKLETLLTQIRPSELLIEKGSDRVSGNAMRILRLNLTNASKVPWNYLKPDTEFLSADNTELEIDRGEYFSDSDGVSYVTNGKARPNESTNFGCLKEELDCHDNQVNNNSENEDGDDENSSLVSSGTLSRSSAPVKENSASSCPSVEPANKTVKVPRDSWPKALRMASEKYRVAFSAFGALLFYLQKLKIDRELIKYGNFSFYNDDNESSADNASSKTEAALRESGKKLILDGRTLSNLEIFHNSFNLDTQGTLHSVLNRCATPFGKRLFKFWICHPLYDFHAIEERLDAVEALSNHNHVREDFLQSLGQYPDLERLLSRVHCKTCKISEFVKLLDALDTVDYSISLLDPVKEPSALINRLVTCIPNIGKILGTWKGMFDRSLAISSGSITPYPGIDKEFDSSERHIQSIIEQLDRIKIAWQKKLNSRAIEFRDNGKEIYQLEIPNTVKQSAIPSTWQQVSSTSKVKRYYFPELRKLVRSLQEAQELHRQISVDIALRFYRQFDENYSTISSVIKILATLDCLGSLARFSSGLSEPRCRPKFIDSDRSCLEFVELRHPCYSSSSTFIPNDIKLGGDHANIYLLTGANAAGKSTILRMTCTAVILAQIGAYLPCKSARLSPIDRIMSRLGANDSIFSCQSTFFVELYETRKILEEATEKSLIIIDELGRGTSTYDGLSIAQAVLHELSTRIGCLAIFATHYRSLAVSFSRHPEISLRRMKINFDKSLNRLTFLYRLEEGISPASFGMHCALMSGIPQEIVTAAESVARSFIKSKRINLDLDHRKLHLDADPDQVDPEVDNDTTQLPLGFLSDVAWIYRQGLSGIGGPIGLNIFRRQIDRL